MAAPSRVIHFRNLGPDVTEADLQQLAQSFGQVERIVVIRSKNQALLSMVELPAAINLIQLYSTVQPTIRGRNIYVQFSSHQELVTPSDGTPGGGRRGEENPNRVVLVTVHNPLYPINVDVINQVFSPFGLVEKIVIFQKPSAGLQALVQFQTQASALQARTALQGRNIYDGCCTLDIQYSNLPELQVNFNNDKTRDYTNNALPEQAAGRGPASLFGEGGSLYGLQGGGRPVFQTGGLYGGVNPMAAAANASAMFGGNLPPGISGVNDRVTIIVSNINIERADPDKLFNLFSNYGSVQRIKMLHNKPDHALIQMGDGTQAEMAVLYVKGASLFGMRLEVNLSKHPQITPSADVRDYSTSTLQRFGRNAARSYRHCCAPTRTIHVSSLPPTATPESVSEFLLEGTGVHGSVVSAKLIEKEGETGTKKQVLVMFDTVETATDTLALKHATNMDGATIRLAFSKSVL